jgi:hypothetical protein
MFFVGQSVVCLGNVHGKVIGVRSSSSGLEQDTIIVEPCKWLLANNKPPTFYMNPKDVTAGFKVGEMISCSFGKGEIKEIRTDGVYVVTLANWALATGKSPILYLQESAIKRYSAQPETTVPDLVDSKSYVEECIAKATQFKNEAADYYKKSNFEGARGKYLEALGAMHVSTFALDL